MRTRINFVFATLVILMTVQLVSLAAGCGASARQQTIAAALTATNASRAVFVAWDASHQTELVSTATSLEDGRQRLDAYRKQREPVVQGFAGVYRLIAAAALARDAGSITEMVDAAKLLHATLKDLGVTP